MDSSQAVKGAGGHDRGCKADQPIRPDSATDQTSLLQRAI